MQCSIVKGAEVIFEGVRVSLTEEASRNIRGGYVYLPPRAEMDAGEYELRLEDGRSRRISVLSVRDWTARFRGSGPLA